MVTGLYAALASILLIGLSYRVGMLRARHKVMSGDGGQEDLRLAIRVQGNFIEYVPIILILMGIYEVGGGQERMLHATGMALLVARGLHAWGYSRSAGPSTGRFVGIVITWIILLVMSAVLLYQYAAAS